MCWHRGGGGGGERRRGKKEEGEEGEEREEEGGEKGEGRRERRNKNETKQEGQPLPARPHLLHLPLALTITSSPTPSPPSASRSCQEGPLHPAVSPRAAEAGGRREPAAAQASVKKLDVNPARPVPTSIRVDLNTIKGSRGSDFESLQKVLEARGPDLEAGPGARPL